MERPVYVYNFSLRCCRPTRAMTFSLPIILDPTQRRTTVGRTPLKELLARRRGLYLTTRNSHNKHSCTPRDSNRQSQQASGRRPTSKTARQLMPAHFELGE
jgi:hypothetical protein